jgi:hypothetical protein
MHESYQICEHFCDARFAFSLVTCESFFLLLLFIMIVWYSQPICCLVYPLLNSTNNSILLYIGILICTFWHLEHKQKDIFFPSLNTRVGVAGHRWKGYNLNSIEIIFKVSFEQDIYGCTWSLGLRISKD